MDHTPFAGLERLEIGDSLGPGFLYANPTIIDILLRIGAVSHRHDAHARLADPVGAPTVTPSNVGGSIPSDTAVYVGWTWLDADGGETLLSDATQVSTDPGLPDPTTAPDAAVDNTAGTLLAGTYYYAVTVTDGLGGESMIGPAIEVMVDPGFPNARVTLSGLDTIMAETGGTGWRLWRAVGAGTWHMMVAGAGASVIDDGSLHGDCDITPPSTAQTNRTNKLTVRVPGPAPAAAVSFNLYLSEDGSFGSPSFVANHPVADVGTDIAILDLLVSTGAPPVVATTFPGAAKIDPDTELVDWHWKRPVANVGALPATGNATGDVRLVEADGSFRYWDGDSWEKPPDLAGHTIQKPDNTLMAARGKLKFAGTAITSVTDDATNDRTIVQIDGGAGGSPVYDIATAIEWQIGGVTVVRLRANQRNDQVLIIDEGFSEAAGALGGGYNADGAGHAIPTAGGNNTNAIYYPLGTIIDGYVEREVTITSANWTRTGITIGHGRKGLFAYIDRATATLILAWRDVDTANEADFHTIASTALSAGPTIGTSYTIGLEKVGNTLTADVWDGATLLAEATGSVPVAMQAEYGAGQSLGAGLSDRWSNPDAWTTDYLQATWYHYHRELWADTNDISGFTHSRRLMADDDEHSSALDSETAPYGFSSAAWGDGTIAGPYYRRDYDGYVTIGGQAMKSTGAAPVNGDVIGTLPPLYAPETNQIVPVATGDDDGVEMGIVQIAPTGVITWLAGRSTAPATKHPYVSFDGIGKYRGTP